MTARADPMIFGAPMIPDAARLTALMAETLAAGWFSNGGALHMRLEQALTGRQRPEDAVALASSGTMALMLALKLGGLKPGGEVITSPLGFAATAQAIEWCGLVPVFADVEPETLTLCPLAARAAMTPRTVAILPVHMLGVPCDVWAFDRLCREHGLWLAYDAAHAFDIVLDGQPIGSFGDCSAFSLHATKILHTGEGGFVVARRAQVDSLRQLRNFGFRNGRAAGPGINGKMSELNAAMGLALLPDLAAEVATRKALRLVYDAALAGVPGLRLHRQRPEASVSAGYYTLRLAPAARARLHAALAEAGIMARDHFPLLCGPGTPWPSAQIVTGGVGPPVAPALAPEILCLPLHGRLSASAAAHIAGVVRRTLEEAA